MPDTLPVTPPWRKLHPVRLVGPGFSAEFTPYRAGDECPQCGLPTQWVGDLKGTPAKVCETCYYVTFRADGPR